MGLDVRNALRLIDVCHNLSHAHKHTNAQFIHEVKPLTWRIIDHMDSDVISFHLFIQEEIEKNNNVNQACGSIRSDLQQVPFRWRIKQEITHY